MSTLEANLKHKRVKTTQEREKVHCYWTIRLAGRLTRRGEQTLLSATLQFAVASRWRANTALCHVAVCRGEQDYSPWRVVTVSCREWRFFTPKTQFSSNPISNLIGNSTCDDSTIWTSIIHEFYGLSTLLQPISTPWPNSQICKTTTTTTC